MVRKSPESCRSLPDACPISPNIHRTSPNVQAVVPMPPMSYDVVIVLTGTGGLYGCSSGLVRTQMPSTSTTQARGFIGGAAFSVMHMLILGSSKNHAVLACG